MNQKLFAIYGLKYNPFISSVPVEALYVDSALEDFYWRLENSVMPSGGFALISGHPGTGKSTALRILASRLDKNDNIKIGILTRPSARLQDFYRELGDVFGVSLNMHNRWLGFKGLRERWLSHVRNSNMCPVLFIDEAQEIPIQVLNEIRILSSEKFDSNNLLTVVFAGDHRFSQKLGREELIPLGSRIRIRFEIKNASTEKLMKCLHNLLNNAGNSTLLTDGVIQTLAEHAMGNYRAMCNMAAELLVQAAKLEKPQIDEELFLTHFSIQRNFKHKRK